MISKLLAMRFELAHAAKNCRDPRQRARLLMKMAALEEKVKAGVYQPAEKRRICAAS